MQILLEGGAKVEEDRAAGGEATAGTNSISGSTAGILAPSSASNVDAAGTTIDPAGGGGGGPEPQGLAAGRVGEGVIFGGGASSAFVATSSPKSSSLAGIKPRPLSYSSSRGDSPRSKAVAAGAALARGEQKTPLLTPRGGSATMAALARDGVAAAGVARAVVIGGAGEGPFTPRRNAKQVGWVGRGSRRLGWVGGLGVACLPSCWLAKCVDDELCNL